MAEGTVAEEIIIPDSEDPGSDDDIVITKEVVVLPHHAGCSGEGRLSPAQVQQQQQQLSRSASSTRLLYSDGVVVDDLATENRKRYLQLTDKAPVVDSAVKPEEEGSLPTPAEVEALRQELASRPELEAQLQQQLTGGGGSSSNARCLLVYQALQAEALSSSGRGSDHQQHGLEQCSGQQLSGANGTAAGDTAEEDVGPEGRPAKRPRMAPPAAADKGAPCSSPGPSQPQQRQQQQLPQQQPPAAHNKAGKGHRQQQKPKPQPPGQQHRQQPCQKQRSGQPLPGPRPQESGPSAGGAASGDENQQRRNLRAKVAQYGKDTVEKGDVLRDPDKPDLAWRLADLQHLGAFEFAQRPREQAQVAGVEADCFQCAFDMIKGFSGQATGRTPGQLVRSLATHYPADPSAALEADADDPVELDWAQLGAQVAHMFRCFDGGVGSMLGGLAGAAKPRAAVTRNARAAVAPEVQPLSGDAAVEQQSGMGQETERVVTEMRRVLECVRRCSMVQLVVDHDSFAHTIENVFALSFLYKDGHVRLECDARAGLMVHHIDKDERAELRRQQQEATGTGRGSGAMGQSQQQFILQLDMQDWRDMREVVAPEDQLMEQRAPHPHPQ